jgi:hypothetical protein
MGESEEREVDSTGRRTSVNDAGRRQPLGYYDDDGTGYEIYNPEDEAESDEDGRLDDGSVSAGALTARRPKRRRTERSESQDVRRDESEGRRRGRNA